MQLKRYLANKSVAVVGNSQNLFSYEYGSEIDSHDIVIRMNRGIIIPLETSFGAKTNVWCYSTFKLVKDIYQSYDCDYKVYMSPKDRILSASQSNELFFPLVLWSRLHSNLEARPSVGAMVTYLLAQCNPSRVTIFGFDFKASKSFYEKANNTGSHNFLRERELLQDFIERNNWVLKDCSRAYLMPTRRYRINTIFKKYFDMIA
ncbi:glycosyltransferase family 29 protein [Pseudovibrio japonicus]|uniref:glycosyltransferase family 29 protein n=1 Tax=Pseudovibrio japonicus TaxID=366534 RepID=UPI0016734F8E|nr:glycosyltransferase family 29 protein [Pseudovibrio japonicus]